MIFFLVDKIYILSDIELILRRKKKPNIFHSVTNHERNKIFVLTIFFPRNKIHSERQKTINYHNSKRFSDEVNE